jgi:methylmalonyl-CoA/ethylmalonyl-CoA epimerase
VTFHHLGIACRSIDAEARAWAALGYTRESERFEDPIQGIRGEFWTGPGPRAELLEALPGSAVLAPWLDRGVKIYHLAWEVDDLDAALEEAKDKRGRVVTGPVPAVAFGGRRIAFVAFPSLLLAEYIATRR